MSEIVLSSLRKTWIIDVDGTILLHNGHLNGEDLLLPGVLEFFNSIPLDDFILLITARHSSHSANLETFLKQNAIRFDLVLYNAPMGERVLINDIKPSGLLTAHSINVIRDHGLKIKIKIDSKL
jgi:hypothetical protein